MYFDRKNKKNQRHISSYVRNIFQKIVIKIIRLSLKK